MFWNPTHSAAAGFLSGAPVNTAEWAGSVSQRWKSTFIPEDSLELTAKKCWKRRRIQYTRKQRADFRNTATRMHLTTNDAFCPNVTFFHFTVIKYSRCHYGRSCGSEQLRPPAARACVCERRCHRSRQGGVDNLFGILTVIKDICCPWRCREKHTQACKYTLTQCMAARLLFFFFLPWNQ